MTFALTIDDWTRISGIAAIVSIIVSVAVSLAVPFLLRWLDRLLRFKVELRARVCEPERFLIHGDDPDKGSLRLEINLRVVNRSQSTVFIKSIGICDRAEETELRLNRKDDRGKALAPSEEWSIPPYSLGIPAFNEELEAKQRELERTVLRKICQSDSRIKIVVSDDRPKYYPCEKLAKDSLLWPQYLNEVHDRHDRGEGDARPMLIR